MFEGIVGITVTAAALLDRERQWEQK